VGYHDNITRISAAALRAAADQFDASAEVLDHVARAQPPEFPVEGAALRRALDRLPVQLAQWSRASAEIACALRAGADDYADAETGAATRIG